MTSPSKIVRHIVRCAAALGVGAAFVGVALAAGPFDGTWKGYGKYPGCRATTDITVKVANRVVSGVEDYAGGHDKLAGTVSDDGSFTGTMGIVPFKGRFEGSKFTGEYTSSTCGPATVFLERSD